MDHRRSLCLLTSAGLVLLLSGSRLAAQIPSDAPADPGADQPPVEEPEAPSSVQESLGAAFRAIEAAEERGPDALTNAWRASQLANYVLSIDPINARAKFVLGRALLLQGRAREALGYLRDYTSQREGESDWLGFKLMGDILHEGKYYKMARGKYEQARKLNNRESTIYVGLARSELALKMYEEAAEHARQAITLDTEPSPEPYGLLAQTELQLKNFAEAETAARRAVDLTRGKLRSKPGDTDLLRRLDGLLILTIQIQRTRQIIYPEQADPYLTIARLIQDRADLARLMAYHQALEMLEQGIEGTAPETPPELLYETAKLQYAVGSNEDARKTLETLLEKQPDHTQAKQLREKIKRELGKT